MEIYYSVLKKVEREIIRIRLKNWWWSCFICLEWVNILEIYVWVDYLVYFKEIKCERFIIMVFFYIFL